MRSVSAAHQRGLQGVVDDREFAVASVVQSSDQALLGLLPVPQLGLGQSHVVENLPTRRNLRTCWCLRTEPHLSQLLLALNEDIQTAVDHLQAPPASAGGVNVHAHLAGVELVPEPQGAVVDQLVAPQRLKRLLEIS